MEIGREYERDWEEERSSVVIGRKKKQEHVFFLGMGFWGPSLLEAQLSWAICTPSRTDCLLRSLQWSYYPPPDPRRDLVLIALLCTPNFTWCKVLYWSMNLFLNCMNLCWRYLLIKTFQTSYWALMESQCE